MTSQRWVRELEQRARDTLPTEVYRYFQQGAREGQSAAEAPDAWDRLRFLPHVLRNVTAVDAATTVLGTTVRAPVAVAPTTMHRAAHPDGEVAMAEAVAAAGSLLVLSSNAGSTFDDVGGTGVPWWLQLYVTAERATSVALLEGAVAAGARAVVLTADTPVVGTKDDGDGATVWDSVQPSWVRHNFGPSYGQAPGEEKATDLGPQDVEWLATTTGLPVVVKGVLRADDARRCVDAGAAAVWVSNHGGRQLDQAVSTAAALRAVAAEVGSDAEVYVDGGVRSGTHVLGALALGARATFLGRLPLYALAAGGPREVTALLERLHREVVEALELSGCPSPRDVEPDLLVPG